MISLLIMLIVIGLVLYLIQMLPLDAVIKQVIYVIAIVMVIVWLLSNLTAFRL